MNYIRDSSGYVVVKRTEPIRVAIIGVASSKGNEKNARVMTASLFKKACARVENVIRENIDVHSSGITLVSGGSSWMDHVAVSLFLKGGYGNLHLYLPCEWDHLRKRYIDTGKYDWKTNPGGLLNSYHRKFSDTAKLSSLDDIDKVNCLNTFSYTVKHGFHPRNDLIAKNCDFLIALSWSEDDSPDDGGTAYTWNRTSPDLGKIHIPLHSI